MEMSGQLHVPAAVLLVNNPRYSLDGLGEPQNRSGRGGEERNSAPAGNRTLVVQPVAY